jgi:hypothetical protein
MKAYEHDVAVSAVAYDSLLVAEIIRRLRPALSLPVVWSGHHEMLDPAPASSLGDARIILVLLHPLWAHEPATAADSDPLRQRVRKDPKSVVVLTVDQTAVPAWLDKAHCHDLDAEGIDPLIESIMARVVKQGGSLVTMAPAEPVAPRYGYDEGPAFLDQSRAQNALRRELERMSDAIESRLDAETARDADAKVELSSAPNRFIARQGDLAISFSWLPGRLGGITDGRLLVIGWAGVGPSRRGTSVLASATQARETTYRVEATDAATWCWRSMQLNGRACSTSDLVGEWFDVSSLTQRDALEGRQAGSALQ